MRAILILLVLTFCYSFPSIIYVIRDCAEKLYNVEEDPEIAQSIRDELLHYNLDDFYEKITKKDPNIKAKIKICMDEIYDKYFKDFNEKMKTIPDQIIPDNY